MTTFHELVPIDVARLASVPREDRAVRFEIGALRGGARTVSVESRVPFLMVSSEKVTPELEVTLNGSLVRVCTVNTMFAAVMVPAGRHEIVFERRIGRGWWPWSAAGLLLLVVGGITDLRRPVARR